MRAGQNAKLDLDVQVHGVWCRGMLEALTTWTTCQLTLSCKLERLFPGRAPAPTRDRRRADLPARAVPRAMPRSGPGADRARLQPAVRDGRAARQGRGDRGLHGVVHGGPAVPHLPSAKKRVRGPGPGHGPRAIYRTVVYYLL